MKDAAGVVDGDEAVQLGAERDRGDRAAGRDEADLGQRLDERSRPLRGVLLGPPRAGVAEVVGRVARGDKGAVGLERLRARSL
jgi:hypothetical protein